MQVDHNKVVIGGVAATQLAEDFGTPLFVIEEDVIRSRFRSLLTQIPYRPLVVHYACKANWNLQVMRVLLQEGAYLDACSPGDVHAGLLAGYQPEQILYTGYAVSSEELDWLIGLGLRLNVDSLAQIERYARLGGRGSLGVRINTGVRAGFHAHVRSATLSSKFGLHPEQLADAVTLAAAHGLSIIGLHTHIGSDTLDVEPFGQALEVLLAAAEQLEHLEYIDLGGGIGVPFSPGDRAFDLSRYGEMISKRLNAWCEQRGRRVALYLEPGEYLVSEAGYVLARVTDIKPTIAVAGEQAPTFVGTDTSFNHMFGAAIYDAYHDVLVANRAQAAPTQRVNICGNLMWAGDVVAGDRPLPALREGDVLVFTNCGAYNMSRASRFNARPLPAEVLVKDGKALLVRKREALDELLLNQIMR